MNILINSLSSQVRSTIIQCLILISVFLFLYTETIVEMANNWMKDDNFSHGFLIPIITIFMIWQRRELLSQEKQDPANWGLYVVIVALLMHIAGSLSAEMFIKRSSIIICIIGMVIFLYGYKRFNVICVPIAYLFFMIPIPKIVWNPIAFPLKLMAAKSAAVIIQLLGIPVLREGNVLNLANISLEVVDACSGLRSLMSLLALSGAFSYMTHLSNIKKWILFLSAVPIAILVNIFRLTITAVLAEYVGAETARGFLHELSGILVFVFACIFLYIVKIGLEKKISFFSK